MCSHYSWDVSKTVGCPTLHLVATTRNLQSIPSFGLVNIIHLVSKFTKTTIMPDLTITLNINLQRIINFAPPLYVF